MRSGTLAGGGDTAGVAVTAGAGVTTGVATGVADATGDGDGAAVAAATGSTSTPISTAFWTTPDSTIDTAPSVTLAVYPLTTGTLAPTSAKMS